MAEDRTLRWPIVAATAGMMLAVAVGCRQSEQGDGAARISPIDEPRDTAGKTTTAPSKGSAKYPARRFNSRLPLRVWVIRTPGGEWTPGGREWSLSTTPARADVEIPACHLWCVSVRKGFDMQQVPDLVAEVRAKRVPGLSYLQ